MCRGLGRSPCSSCGARSPAVLLRATGFVGGLLWAHGDLRILRGQVRVEGLGRGPPSPLAGTSRGLRRVLSLRKGCSPMQELVRKRQRGDGQLVVCDNVLRTQLYRESHLRVLCSCTLRPMVVSRWHGHWQVTWVCCAPLRCKCCDRCKCRECKQPDAVEPGDAAATPGDAEAPSPGTHAAKASHSGQVPGGVCV